MGSLQWQDNSMMRERRSTRRQLPCNPHFKPHPIEKHPRREVWNATTIQLKGEGAMRCWQSLPAVTLNPSAEVTAAFLTIGARSYRAAAAHVGELPYGRNSDIDDPLIVIREGRGTCSTKH